VSALTTGSASHLTERRLATLAVLRAHWEDKQSYVDTFLPFVLECARLDGRAAIPLNELNQAVLNEFGISMPIAALEALLKRATDMKRGGRPYGTLRRRCFEPNRPELPEFDSRSSRVSALREQAALLDRLQKYASEDHQYELDRRAAEEALIGFIEQHASTILSAAHGSVLWRRSDGRELEYVLGSFIAAVLDHEPEMASYLERLVVGTMIASALYAQDITEIERSFEGVEVYLDTPTLIDALGHAGDPPKRAQMESLRLIAAVGGRLHCFEHTVAEMESVLFAAADAVRNGRRDRPAPAGSVEEYALQNEIPAADLEKAARQVRARLVRQGIKVNPAPPHVDSLTIDEVAAQEMMRESVKYPREQTLRYDLDSVTAVYRTRSGVHQYQLEKCIAIFATPNVPLVHTARRFLPSRRDAVPVAMSLADLVTLAWLKQPRVAPELPKLRIAADCFAAVRPSEALIARYSAEADALRKKGAITDEDVHELRYDVEARRILTRRVHGEAKNVTPEILRETLEERHQQIRVEARAGAEREAREARAELVGERERREAAESERDELQTRVGSLEATTTAAREAEDRGIVRRAARRARLLTLPLFVFVFFACVIVAVVTFPFVGDHLQTKIGLAWLNDHAGWLFWPSAAIAVGTALLVAILNIGWGISVRSLLAPVERRVASALERRYRRDRIFATPTADTEGGR
jgi:hypothetical protein